MKFAIPKHTYEIKKLDTAVLDLIPRKSNGKIKNTGHLTFSTCQYPLVAYNAEKIVWSPNESMHSFNKRNGIVFVHDYCINVLINRESKRAVHFWGEDDG